MQKPPWLARLLRSPLPTCLQHLPPLPVSGNKQPVPAPLGISRKVNAACEGPEPPLTGAGKPPGKLARGPGLPAQEVTSSAPRKVFASSFGIFRLCAAKASFSHPHVSPPAFPSLKNQQEFQAKREAGRSAFTRQAGRFPPALGVLLEGNGKPPQFFSTPSMGSCSWPWCESQGNAAAKAAVHGPVLWLAP